MADNAGIGLLLHPSFTHVELGEEFHLYKLYETERVLSIEESKNLGKL